MLNIINKDCIIGIKEIDDNSVNTIITSPPYNKKGLSGNKKIGNQIWNKFNINYENYGDEMPEEDYQKWMIEILNECYRVLAKNGSMFFNHKPRRNKNICHLPTDFINKSKFNIYQVIIWNRKNSPNIRNDILVPCTEYIYWLSKEKPKVFRNNLEDKYKSEVWEMTVERQKLHPAPFPSQLPKNCILLTTEENDLVLDPFAGTGTTLKEAEKLNRKSIGFELTEKYYK